MPTSARTPHHRISIPPGTHSPRCGGGRGPAAARRHTQVPPYIHKRTAGMERRAGPMCPAAGMHRKPHIGLLIAHRRAGACPRRRRGCPTMDWFAIRTRPVGADAHIGPHTAPSNFHTAWYAFALVHLWMPPNTAGTMWASSPTFPNGLPSIVRGQRAYLRRKWPNFLWHFSENCGILSVEVSQNARRPHHRGHGTGPYRL